MLNVLEGMVANQPFNKTIINWISPPLWYTYLKVRSKNRAFLLLLNLRSYTHSFL